MKKSGLYLLLLLLFCGCANSDDNNIYKIDHPAPSNSEFPFLYSVEETLYMSWLSRHTGDDSHALNYARYTDGKWDSPRTIARDSSWFVNWADFPSIIGGKNGPMAVHWLDKIPGGTYAYNVNLALSDSKGNWTPPVTPHSDGTATEHGFVSMVPWDDQTALVVWLDGRQSAGDNPDDYYNISNAMTLRGALVTSSGEVKESFLIDDTVCDCCQTSLIKTKKGAIVAYRNRTENEIRDIYLSRFNGNSWSSPEPAYDDHWEIGACPVNGPSLAAKDSLVVLSWYTAVGDQPTVKAAISTDEGITFNKPIQMNAFTAKGRVGAAVFKGDPYVSWMEKEDGQVYVKIQKVTATNSSPVVIGTIDESRQSGFPQLVSLRDKLVLAWTDISKSQPQIMMWEYIP